jgi:hypothetical protein
MDGERIAWRSDRKLAQGPGGNAPKPDIYPSRLAF